MVGFSSSYKLLLGVYNYLWSVRTFHEHSSRGRNRLIDHRRAAQHKREVHYELIPVHFRYHGAPYSQHEFVMPGLDV